MPEVDKRLAAGGIPIDLKERGQKERYERLNKIKILFNIGECK